MKPNRIRARIFSSMIVAALATALLGLVQGPASAAGYQVTSTPITWFFTYSYKYQTGTTTTVVSAAHWTGTATVTDTLDGTANSCHFPVVPGSSPARTWYYTPWDYTSDLSQYRFNSVSSIGVQRRHCSFTAIGPNAANPDCVPTDCQVKVEFGAGTFHPEVDRTDPTYAWANLTSNQYSYGDFQGAYGYCSSRPDYYQNCSAPQQTLHPEQATSTTMAYCPSDTTAMQYACTPLPDPVKTPTTGGGSTTGSTGTSGGTGATGTIGSSVTWSAPVPTSKPAVGKTVSVTPTIANGATVKYTWRVGGKKVSGTSPSLKVRPAFRGKKITVTVKVTSTSGARAIKVISLGKAH